MDPIFDAMAAIDAREPGDKHTYRAAEKQFGVNKTRCVAGTRHTCQ
jgi:hypothetical protein